MASAARMVHNRCGLVRTVRPGEAADAVQARAADGAPGLVPLHSAQGQRWSAVRAASRAHAASSARSSSDIARQYDAISCPY